MNKTICLAVLVLTSLVSSRVRAQERHGDAPAGHPAAGAANEAAAERTEIGPVPPDVGIAWPGLVLLIIGTMFVLAAVIGPVVRLHAPPDEPPPTHSHDEPPGASHHHGASGMLNPEPYHGHVTDHEHPLANDE